MHRFLVQATVVGVNDGNVLYPSCLQCYAKMLHNLHTDRWQCLRCNMRRRGADLSWRYRLSLCIADMSATCNLSLFGGTLVQHFGCPAGALHQFLHGADTSSRRVEEETVLEAVQTALVGNRYVFCLKTACLPQHGTSTVPHPVPRPAEPPTSRHYCLADLLSAAVPPASQKVDGKLSDFVAVQMVHVGTRACADTPTVLSILKRLVTDHHNSSPLGERDARNTPESPSGKERRVSPRKGGLLRKRCCNAGKGRAPCQFVKCPCTPGDDGSCAELDTSENQTVLSKASSGSGFLSEASSGSGFLSQSSCSSQAMLRFSCQSSMDQEFASSVGSTSSGGECAETSHREDPGCSGENSKGTALTSDRVPSSEISDVHCHTQLDLSADDSFFSYQDDVCLKNVYNKRTFPSPPGTSSDSGPPHNLDNCDKTASHLGKELNVGVACLHEPVINTAAQDETVLDSQNTLANLDQSARDNSIEEFLCEQRDSQPLELQQSILKVADGHEPNTSFSDSLNDSSLLLAAFHMNPPQDHSLAHHLSDQSQVESVTANTQITHEVVSLKQFESITKARHTEGSELLSQDRAGSRVAMELESMQDLPDSEDLSMFLQAMAGGQGTVSPCPHLALDAVMEAAQQAGEDTHKQGHSSTQNTDNQGHSTAHDTDNQGHSTAHDTDNQGHSTAHDTDNHGHSTAHDTDNHGHSTAHDTDNHGHSTAHDTDNHGHSTAHDTDNHGHSTAHDNQGHSTAHDNQGHSTAHDTDNHGHSTAHDTDNHGHSTAHDTDNHGHSTAHDNQGHSTAHDNQGHSTAHDNQGHSTAHDTDNQGHSTAHDTYNHGHSTAHDTDNHGHSTAHDNQGHSTAHDTNNHGHSTAHDTNNHGHSTAHDTNNHGHSTAHDNQGHSTAHDTDNHGHSTAHDTDNHGHSTAHDTNNQGHSTAHDNQGHSTAHDTDNQGHSTAHDNQGHSTAHDTDNQGHSTAHDTDNHGHSTAHDTDNHGHSTAHDTDNHGHSTAHDTDNQGHSTAHDTDNQGHSTAHDTDNHGHSTAHDTDNHGHSTAHDTDNQGHSTAHDTNNQGHSTAHDNQGHSTAHDTDNQGHSTAHDTDNHGHSTAHDNQGHSTAHDTNNQGHSTAHDTDNHGHSTAHDTDNQGHSTAHDNQGHSTAHDTDNQGHSTAHDNQGHSTAHDTDNQGHSTAHDTDNQGHSTAQKKGQDPGIWIPHSSDTQRRDDDELSPDLFEESIHSPSVLHEGPSFPSSADGRPARPRPVQSTEKGPSPCASSKKVCVCHLGKNCVCSEESEWTLFRRGQVEDLQRSSSSICSSHICRISTHKDPSTDSLWNNFDQTDLHKNPQRTSSPKNGHTFFSHRTRFNSRSSGKNPKRTVSNLHADRTGLLIHPHGISSHENPERYVSNQDSHNCVSEKQCCEAKLAIGALRPGRVQQQEGQSARSVQGCEDSRSSAFSRGQLSTVLMPDSKGLDAFLSNLQDRHSHPTHSDASTGKNTDHVDSFSQHTQNYLESPLPQTCQAVGMAFGKKTNLKSKRKNSDHMDSFSQHAERLIVLETPPQVVGIPFVQRTNLERKRSVDQKFNRKMSLQNDLCSADGLVLSSSQTDDCFLDGSADLFSQDTDSDVGTEDRVSAECGLDSWTSSQSTGSGVTVNLPCRPDGLSEEGDQDSLRTIEDSSSSVDNNTGYSLFEKSDHHNSLSSNEADDQYKISSQVPHHQQHGRVRFSRKRRISSILDIDVRLEHYCSPQQHSQLQLQQRDAPPTPQRSCLRQCRVPLSSPHVAPKAMEEKSVKPNFRSALTPITAETHNVDRTLRLSCTQGKTPKFSTPVICRPQAASTHTVDSSTAHVGKEQLTQGDMTGEISGSQDLFSPCSAQDQTKLDGTVIQDTPKLQRHSTARNNSARTQRGRKNTPLFSSARTHTGRENTPLFSSAFHTPRHLSGLNSSDILFDDSESVPENDSVLQWTPVLCSPSQRELGVRGHAGSVSEAVHTVAEDMTRRRSVKLDLSSVWSMSPDLFSP